MLMARGSKTEGRGGSQRRLDEGGRYLGIPQNGGLAAPRTGSDEADAHNSGLLSVQETGCGTRTPVPVERIDERAVRPRSIGTPRDRVPQDSLHRPQVSDLDAHIGQVRFGNDTDLGARAPALVR